VAATNKDLKAEIARGAFREDLFYRLNVVPFHIPPLRERREDIAGLAQHFLREFSMSHGRKPRAFQPEALKVLDAYSWPGNVRELKNLIERVIILTSEAEEGRPITASTLLENLQDDALAAQFKEVTSPSIARPSEPEAPSSSRAVARNLKDARHGFEKDFIIKTLKENDWNISKAAQVLGVERSHLHRKIKSFGIEEKE
jgi:two-component system nitrogen regulation response regulator NtrX